MTWQEASINLQALKIKCEFFQASLDKHRHEKQTLLAHQVSLQTELSVSAVAEEWYQKAIDLIYQSSIGDLEKQINDVLAYVFFDKSLVIKIELDELNGKSVFFPVFDMSYDPPLEIDLREGKGDGVRTVVSFVLHLYYLLSKVDKPLLILDETYGGLSEQYVDRFFSFVQRLCTDKKVTIVFITHDPRFLPYANNAYYISDGNVKKVMEGGTNITIQG